MSDGSAAPPGAAYRAGLASEHSAFQQTSAPAAAAKGNSGGSIYDTPITKTNLQNMYEAPLSQTRPTVADSLSSRGPPPPPPAPVAGASATELYGRGPPQPPPSVSSLPGLGGLPVTRPAAGTAAPRDGIEPPRESALPPRPAQPPAEPAASSSNPPPAASQGPLPPRPAAAPGEPPASTPVASTPAVPPQSAAQQPPLQRDSPSQRMFPSQMPGFPPFGYPPSAFGFGMQHPAQAGFGQQQQPQAAQGTGGADPYAPLTRCYQGLAAQDTAPQGIGSEYFDKYRALTRDPSNSDYFRTDIGGMAGRDINSGVPPESMSLEEKISLTRNRDYLRIGLGLGLEGGPAGVPPGAPPGVPPAAATATAALGGGAVPGVGQSGFGGGAFGANPLLGNYGQPNPYGGYGGLAAQGLGAQGLGAQNPGYGGYPGAAYPGGLGGGLGAFGSGFAGQAGGYTQQPPRQGEVRGAADQRNPLGFGLSNSAGGPGGPGGLGGRTGNTPEDLRQRFKSF